MNVISITLKDGTYIDRCVIFNENPKNGDEPIQNEDEIHQQFQIYPWGNERRIITFQSASLHGFIPVMNVDSYEIYSVDRF